MNSEIYQRNDCRLCGGTNLEEILTLKDSPLCDVYTPDKKKCSEHKLYPMRLFSCGNCKFVQMSDVVAPEFIYKDYIYLTTSSMGLADHFKTNRDAVLKSLELEQGSQVMDIGSNDGTLLSFYKESGMKVLGVEPATEIAKAANQNGIETIESFFNEKVAESILESHGKADLITVNNLYANVDDLNSFTQGIAHLLSDEGVFCFESFYIHDYINNFVFDFMYHEHISYFGVKPLKLFFKKFGMEIFKVESISTKGGSIRVYTKKKTSNKYPIHPTVEEKVKLEEALGLDNPKEVFSSYKERITSAKNNVKKTLSKLKNEGKRVVGYGASATTQTMMYEFELVEEMEHILDDNPAKIDTYSPGSAVPVYNSEKIYEDKPDVIFIYAWRYAEPIMKRHEKFLKEGGTFVIPIPELRVVNGQ